MQARRDVPLQADRAGVVDRPAHDPPQHVAPALVARLDPVAGQEAHRPPVVGEHPQRLGLPLVDAVARARPLLDLADHVAEGIGLEDAVHALRQGGDALHAGAGVDAGRGQRLQATALEHVVLHENEVPELQEPVAVAAGGALGPAAAVRRPAVEVELRARAAGAGRPRLPEVVAAQPDDPLGGHADRAPQLDRLLVGGDELVALVDGDPDLVGVEREPGGRGDQLPGQVDRRALEVVAEREVAHHLEEGEVTGRVARPRRCRPCGSTSAPSSRAAPAALRRPGSTASTAACPRW